MLVYNNVVNVLYAWVVCSSLKYCIEVILYCSMLNECIVYVYIILNQCKLNVECNVYMKSQSMLGRLDECTEHTHAEQAKLSRYSLC